MNTRRVGDSGLHAPVVGLGTWVLGGSAVRGQDPDDAESIRANDAALKAGINLIDTAPAYGWGRSEEAVGKAINGGRVRLHDDFDERWSLGNQVRCSRQCRRSAGVLGLSLLQRRASARQHSRPPSKNIHSPP